MALISNFTQPLPQADVLGMAIAGFDQGRKDRRDEDALMRLAKLGQVQSPGAPASTPPMSFAPPQAQPDALTTLVNGSHTAAAGATDPALSDALSAKGYETPQVLHGTNSARAMQYFINNGYSPAQAAGIVGNLMQESGADLNVAAINPGDGADGSNSIGIAQWNADRARGLHAYAAANGGDVNNLETQLGYINHELNTTEGAARAALMQATNPIEAAAAFAGFERPAGWSADNPYGAHGWGNRAQNAANLAGIEYAPAGSPVGWAGAPQGASPYTFDPETMQALLLSEETRPLALSLIEAQQGANASRGRYTVEAGEDGAVFQRDTLTGETKMIMTPKQADPSATESFFGNTVYMRDPATGEVIAGQVSNRGNFKPINAGDGYQPAIPVTQLDTGTGFTAVDKFGNPTGEVTPIDNQGAKYDEAFGSAAGKAAAERIDALPGLIANANNMVGTIDGILNDPALDASTGWLSWMQGVPNTDQFRFGQRALQLQGQSFLQAFENLRGGGQITEVEGTKATQAIGRLSTAQKPADYRSALDELKGIINAAKTRAIERTGGAPEAQSAPVQIKTTDDYFALPSGAQYVDPDGNLRTKP